MENTLSEALILLVVGMGTVFLALLLIINMSKLLIMIINKIAPEEVVVTKNVNSAPVAAIDPKMTEIITKAISLVAKDSKIVDIKKI